MTTTKMRLMRSPIFHEIEEIDDEHVAFKCKPKTPRPRDEMTSREPSATLDGASRECERCARPAAARAANPFAAQLSTQQVADLLECTKHRAGKLRSGYVAPNFYEVAAICAALDTLDPQAAFSRDVLITAQPDTGQNLPVFENGSLTP